jgi:hypothetical protein
MAVGALDVRHAAAPEVPGRVEVAADPHASGRIVPIELLLMRVIERDANVFRHVVLSPASLKRAERTQF